MLEAICLPGELYGSVNPVDAAEVRYLRLLIMDREQEVGVTLSRVFIRTSYLLVYLAVI